MISAWEPGALPAGQRQGPFACTFPPLSSAPLHKRGLRLIHSTPFQMRCLQKKRKKKLFFPPNKRTAEQPGKFTCWIDQTSLRFAFQSLELDAAMKKSQRGRKSCPCEDALHLVIGNITSQPSPPPQFSSQMSLLFPQWENLSNRRKKHLQVLHSESSPFQISLCYLSSNLFLFCNT